MIKQVFKRLVDYFYEELPELEHAQCCIFTADDADIRRLVRATLRQRGADELVKAASPFLTGRIQ
jgi:bisphosphoglycerate-dependent phosphoglycerate mutase